jgi:UDP-N-acetylmuramate dehydrogenase
MLIEENKPLAPFTTFGIGGPARWFAQAASEDDLIEAADWARERALPLFVLGGGSNLLVSDAGFNGFVLRVGLRGIAVAPIEEDSLSSRPPQEHTPGAEAPVNYGGIDVRAKALTYQAAAGEDWDAFVERAVQDNCAGIECLAGIPGTVGGTPVQNVGAYGQEVASVIDRVRAFDLDQRAFVEFPAAECGFAYRRSRFNSAERGRYIVTRVDYRLTPGGAPTVRYAELERALSPMRAAGKQPSLADAASAVRLLRQSKGMLLVEGDPNCRSAGSFFKNPVVAREQFRYIATASAMKPPCFPAGPEPENQDSVKVPAAWLIEQAGFAKGYALGRAAVSSRHTLALVNCGGATATEILALANEITAAVETRFGVHLEMEPAMVGF